MQWVFLSNGKISFNLLISLKCVCTIGHSIRSFFICNNRPDAVRGSRFHHNLNSNINLPAAELFFFYQTKILKTKFWSCSLTLLCSQTLNILCVISLSRDKGKPCFSAPLCLKKSRTLPRVHWLNPSLSTWAGLELPAWMSSRYVQVSLVFWGIDLHSIKKTCV